MKNGADAGPQAVLVPAPIATVEGVPGAEGWWDLPPGHAGAHDPEQALEQTAVVERRAATGRLLRRQKRRHLLPETVGQGCGAREHRRRWWVSGCRQRLARRPPRDMPPARERLVLATPLRPVQPLRARGASGLGEQEQETPYLGQGQGDVLAGSSPPFPSRAALWRVRSRVTSRVAWASSARVT